MKKSPVASRQPPARRLRTIGVAVCVFLLVGACGGTGTPGSSSTEGTSAATTSSVAAGSSTPTPTTATTSVTAATTTTAAPGTTLFRGNTVTTSQDASGDQGGSLIDVRIEDRDGFTRIVFEFNGPGTPFWQVGEVQRPFFVDYDEPADREVLGSDYLMVVAYPAEVGASFGGSLTVLMSEGPVAEVTFLGNGRTGMHWIVGTRGPKPFLGATYRDPARLELDIGDGP